MYKQRKMTQHQGIGVAAETLHDLPVEAGLCVAIDRCRICGSEPLEDVISLGEQRIASLFPPRAGLPEHLNQAFPLQVVRCSSPEGCGLVQLRHSVAPQVLYSHYGYRSGTNEMMRANLREIAAAAQEVVRLHAGDVVVDIGCNDGTLLKNYSNDLLRIGIDPSDAVDNIDDPDIRIIRDFFSHDALERSYPDRRARVVTSIAMFYDLEDPGAFARDVAAVLTEDGVWIVELSYLPSMLRTNAFDTICHEHLEYYSLRSIEWMLKEQGLRVTRAEINNVNGGSIRLFIRRDAIEANPDEEENLQALRLEEDAFGLHTDLPFDVFRGASESIRRQLSYLVETLVAAGKRVYVYGASTKGNTLLQFCGLDEQVVQKAADRNPDKWGTFTIGTNIPIVSEDEARADDPDYFLILPWHFLDGFVQREREFLARGGRFIVPLPHVRILDRNSVEIQKVL